MLCDADLKVSWRSRPQGFIALMSLYESNYLRFAHLVGDPKALSGTRVSRVQDDCDLLLTVVEHMPYTSILNLTYLLPATMPLALAGDPAPAGLERQPDLRLRIYHDARLLEAGEFSSERRITDAELGGVARSRRGERELQQRWLRNIMLNKWLEYCAERGHRFLR